MHIYFVQKKARSRLYPAETMTDADYDQVLLTNTPAPAKSSLHSLEQATEGMGFYANIKSTEFMCFK